MEIIDSASKENYRKKKFDSKLKKALDYQP